MNLFSEKWNHIISWKGNNIIVRHTRHFERRWKFVFEDDVSKLPTNYNIVYID